MKEWMGFTLAKINIDCLCLVNVKFGPQFQHNTDYLFSTSHTMSFVTQILSFEVKTNCYFCQEHGHINESCQRKTQWCSSVKCFSPFSIQKLIFFLQWWMLRLYSTFSIIHHRIQPSNRSRADGMPVEEFKVKFWN